MINPIESPQDVSEAIKRIERNLVCIREKQYTASDRRVLKEIYNSQLVRYKQKQLSFYSKGLK